MFDVVRGVVSITGTAAGPDFSGYRLQIGDGLSPQSWYQTGEDFASQVVKGDSGFWDTTGLDGLYAIQLLVIHQDKSVQRSGVLVTVDNQPPMVEVAHPLDGAQISSEKKPELVVEIQAEDNLNLEMYRSIWMASCWPHSTSLRLQSCGKQCQGNTPSELSHSIRPGTSVSRQSISLWIKQTASHQVPGL